MKLFLTGLLQDGTTPQPGILTNAASTLSVPRGGSVELQVDVLRPDGTMPDLTGYTAIWACRIQSSQYERRPGFTKTVSVAIPPDPHNRFLFALVPTDTWRMLPLRYVYDVWIVSGAGVRDLVVPLSALVLTPALTRP